MSSEIDLSIVIVNWNSKEYLRACLESVLQRVGSLRSEVIVVDSGSFDGCGELLREQFPQVRFVQSQDNVGFASANNIGARLAQGTILLFLNPDTEVRGTAIQALVEAQAAIRDVGIVGPRLLNTDGSLQASCVQALPTIPNQLLDIECLHRWFPEGSLWQNAAMHEGRTEAVQVEALSGACMAVRKDIFDCAGGFSEDYFMYAEDLDLCWKIRQTGYRNYYLPMADVVHHGGGSTQHGRSHFSEVMVPESVSRLLKKTHGKAYSRGFRMALSASAVIRLLVIGLTYPVSVVVGKATRWRIIFKKWVTILRWGLGMERWVKQYGHSD